VSHGGQIKIKFRKRKAAFGNESRFFICREKREKTSLAWRGGF
jgi:hypothetical protein